MRELARELSVNPNTVVRAYQALEEGGVILRRQGAGCFIKDAASSLSDEAREAQLNELVNKALTEAYHLGFTKGEIRSALDEGFKKIRATKRGTKS